MEFNPHYDLEGKHSILSASQYHWLRYSDEKMLNRLKTMTEAQRGTELHAFAAEAIRLGIKLVNTKQTLNLYVNDAIAYRMSPEVSLFYSPNAFATADAISFRKERGRDRELLRIHDLKNGVSKASVNQLEIYAAYFCLEYNVKPTEIDIELRIYQHDMVQVYIPDAMDITVIMDRIVSLDQLINKFRMGAVL